MPRVPRVRLLLLGLAATLGLVFTGSVLTGGDGQAVARFQLAAPDLDVPALPVPTDVTARGAGTQPEEERDEEPRTRTVSLDDDAPSSDGRSADEELEGGGLGADGDAATDSGAPTDAEIAAELRRMRRFSNSSPTKARLTAKGNVIAPDNAPAAVKQIIAGANLVARKPYRYGGGHNAKFVDTAYDCSGSISYALATAGLVRSPMASGPMMRWGRKGPGKWVTIYANPGHAYMVVAGVRFDTSGRGSNGSRWQANMRSGGGFTAVHPPGL